MQPTADFLGRRFESQSGQSGGVAPPTTVDPTRRPKNCSQLRYHSAEG